MGDLSKILIESESMFMRFGIRSVTMDDIARHLGISKKTLYQFVDNKGDLIAKIFEKKLAEEQAYIAEINSNSQDAVEEILRLARYTIRQLREMPETAVFDLKKYYGDIWQIIETHHQSHVYDMIKNNLILGIEQGVYRENLNPEVIARLYVGKTSLVADEDIFPPDQIPMSELFKEHIYYHIHGVASSKGLKLMEQHLKAMREHE